MRSKVLYSPTPYFILTALFSLVPVLNNKYPAAFFPMAPEGWVDIIATVAGTVAAFKGLGRWWAILQTRAAAKVWIMEANEARLKSESLDPNDVVNAGRYVSRLVRNVDKDLEEINPDFTLVSLGRLNRYLPELLMEVDSEESAQIRLGIVGAYIGETLCRAKNWQWFFKSNPALKQFSFLPSEVQKNGRKIDPFELAAQAFEGKTSLTQLLKDAQ